VDVGAALDLINSEEEEDAELDQAEEELPVEEESKAGGGQRPGEPNRRDVHNEKLLALIRQAEPIAEKSAYNPQSLEEAAWRRKKVRQLQLNT
jgi:hypothetical protein